MLTRTYLQQQQHDVQMEWRNERSQRNGNKQLDKHQCETRLKVLQLQTTKICRIQREWRRYWRDWCKCYCTSAFLHSSRESAEAWHHLTTVPRTAAHASVHSHSSSAVSIAF